MDKNIRIKDVGIYLPTKKITNIDTAKKYGYDEKFIENKIGFKTLLRKDDKENLIDFCMRAYENLKRKDKYIK